jgi:hypothetical protein
MTIGAFSRIGSTAVAIGHYSSQPNDFSVDILLGRAGIVANVAGSDQPGVAYLNFFSLQSTWQAADWT